MNAGVAKVMMYVARSGLVCVSDKTIGFDFYKTRKTNCEFHLLFRGGLVNICAQQTDDTMSSPTGGLFTMYLAPVHVEIAYDGP
jgi:hypothetical protein